jgi:hypothetical protein
VKLYKVTYEGLWMGGVAIVIAENETQAIELVKEHYGTVNFCSAPTVDLLQSNGVIYNNNGDY